MWSWAVVMLLLALGPGAAAQIVEQWPDEDPIMGQDEQIQDDESPPPSEELEDFSAEPGPDRIRFQIPFPEDKGGGVATGTAGNLEYVREDYVVASGGVELQYQDLQFQGQKVTVDLKTEQVTAEGDVIIDQGPKRLVGDTLVFDLATKTGTVTNAKAFVDPDIFFEGEIIKKVAEDTYEVTDGMVTSCIDDNPDWSFRLAKGRVEIGGWAKGKHARFRVKKVPLLYFPQILYPASTDRRSGFLFPNLGYSERRGALLGLAYFLTLGPSYDTTLYADFYSENYIGVGNEFRYRPSENTRGIFEGYAIDDPDSDELRWKVFWSHVSEQLPLGMRGVVRYQNFSDFNFFRDFERDFSNVAIRRLRSEGFLTGSWGQQSLTLLVDQNETFISQGDITTTRRLPELEYRLRPTELAGLPIYLDLVSSVDYLQSARTEKFDQKWGRADLFPNLTVALSTLPWLSVSVSAGERVTWYGDSRTEDGTALSGDSLTRAIATANSNIVGPSFSRVFDGKVGRFGKFKHIVEPRWSYRYVQEFEDADQILRFDEIDFIPYANVFSVNLVNRLLAKPIDEELYGGAREIMSLEIGQLYSLDETVPLQSSADRTLTSTQGPVNLRYRFNPSRTANLEARLSYSTLFNELFSTSVSGGMRLGPHGAGLTWFTSTNPETGKSTGNQVRFYAGVELWPSHLRLDTQINYDFELSLLQSQRYIIQYFSQCFGYRLEYRDWRSVTREDREIRFALTLKNIGTFLDLSGGTRNGFSPGY
jgi:LPS-assembly protein